MEHGGKDKQRIQQLEHMLQASLQHEQKMALVVNEAEVKLAQQKIDRLGAQGSEMDGHAKGASETIIHTKDQTLEEPGRRRGEKTKDKPLGRPRGYTRNSGAAEYVVPSRERKTDKYTLLKESSPEGEEGDQKSRGYGQAEKDGFAEEKIKGSKEYGPAGKEGRGARKARGDDIMWRREEIGADAARGSKGVVMVYSEDSSTTPVSGHHQEEFEWYAPSRKRPGKLKETKRSGQERRSSSRTSPERYPEIRVYLEAPAKCFKGQKAHQYFDYMRENTRKERSIKGRHPWK